MIRIKRYIATLLICLGLFLIFPTDTHAACANSTCITPEIIADADHALVIYSPAVTHYDFLLFDRDYFGTTNTGVTAFRQEAPGKIGITIEYNDAFCTMEGAALTGVPAEECLP